MSGTPPVDESVDGDVDEDELLDETGGLLVWVTAFWVFSGFELTLSPDLDLADAVPVLVALAVDEVPPDPVAGTVAAEWVAAALLLHRAIGAGPGEVATFPAGLELLVLTAGLVVSPVLGEEELVVSLALGEEELVVSLALGLELSVSEALAPVLAALLLLVLLSLLLDEVAGAVEVWESAGVPALPVEADVLAAVDAEALFVPHAVVGPMPAM